MLQPCLPFHLLRESAQYVTYKAPLAVLLLKDLHVYDPAAMAWTDLSAAASGTPPSAREDQGFTSTGGRIYVYGGKGEIGEGRVRASSEVIDWDDSYL